MRICVVGAGPAGSYAALLLAQQGHKVDVFEDHPEIGLPVQCTGIVTKALFDLIEKDEYIIQTVNTIKINAPTHSMEMPLHEHIICRHKFDNFLAKKAQEAGATYHLEHRFLRVENGEAVFRHKGEEKTVPFGALIGADGPNSEVAKAAGLEKQSFWVGIQATMEGTWDSNRFETWFGSAAPGFFAWSVPESSSLSRVGVAGKKPRVFFDRLRENLDCKVKEMQGGPIPIYKKRAVQKDNIYLVGDAAGFVKATTGGGIITGMLSSKALATALLKQEPYERHLRPLRKELRLHSLLRWLLDRFKDKDYDRLVRLMQNKKIKQILYDHPREFPSKFLGKLLLAEPRLLLFGKVLLQKDLSKHHK